MTKNRNRIYLYLILGVTLLVIFTILFIPGYYKIEIYQNYQPSDDGAVLVGRCYSLDPNFECSQKNPISGTYVKAVTYFKGEKLSESGWEVVGDED